jgi:Siphovirus Gp157
MVMIALDPIFVQRQISDLLLANPELAEDEVLRADMIEGSTDAFEFLRTVVRKIGMTEATAHGTTEYIAQLRERQARLERREYALRQLIHKVMDTADLRKCELPEATLSIRAGQPKVVILNEAELPQEFMRVKTEPDKTKLKAAMQAHEHVPGAALSNAEPVLSIRVK